VLASARLANQAIAFVGPVLLVRLLSVEQYGEYRDFVLYAVLLLPLVQLTLSSSLAYFVPKEPEHERIFVSQVHFLVLCSSLVVAGLLLAFGSHLPSPVVRGHVVPLCLYLLFSANFDAWEVYWLAKRRVATVLYYSIARLGLRLAVVVGTAYLTRSVEHVIWALVAFEGLRMGALVLYALRGGFITVGRRFDMLKRQLEYSLPLGASSIVYHANVYLGQFFVSMMLGPAALAVYSVGTYLQPVIQVFRNSVADVIMPEIVSRRDVPPSEALGLWQRATVVYCAVMLPLAVVLAYYADVIVNTLFTSAYAAAVPIFQIYVLLLVRECFDLGLPLRALNHTRVFLPGGVLSLLVNIGVMLLLFEPLGLLAPAVAMVVARVVAGVYLAVFVVRHGGFSASSMLPWSDMAKAAAISVLCAPILVLGDAFDAPGLVRAAVFGTAYLAACFLFTGVAGVPEIRLAAMRVRAQTWGLIRPIPAAKGGAGR
jgi:O-antigen/teichoic acid export membrane protein